MTQPKPTESVAQAVLYAAKSTEDEHGSIKTQLADCQALALREGWEVVGRYQDEAASAYKGDRGPGLAAALGHAERIKGALIVQHTDRLARGDAIKARHLIEIYLWALKADVILRSVQDDSTCENIVMAAVMGERNTEDSRRKSEATRSGKRRAWERGDFPGGPRPDGFDVVGAKDARMVRHDPSRIKIIRLIGELADQEWSDASIARELNRRGHRTKAGGAWTRRRIKDVLSNPIYCGGVPWHQGTPEEEINWQTSFPTPWTREDYERRAGARGGRATGSNRPRPGRPNANHALAGLAVCGKCSMAGRLEFMFSITSTYRRKDGSRKRTYVCPHVQRSTGLCDAPRVDAEMIDTHVINELHRYLGDFETWRDQLLSGYASERRRLEREFANAVDQFEAQVRICERADRLGSLASNDSETRTALRIAAQAHAELDRRQTRLEATQRALDEVPDEAPADAMLDFYNELGAAVRGRLEGARTIARVNDALRDLFEVFVLDPPPLGNGIVVMPILRTGRREGRDDQALSRWITDEIPDWMLDLAREQGIDDPQISPPLRKIHASDRNRPTPSRTGR